MTSTFLHRPVGSLMYPKAMRYVKFKFKTVEKIFDINFIHP